MTQPLIPGRKLWIDWMKVLGMVFIIWGHMFPYYFTNFVYSFSVPAFFWASGYLAKDQNDKLIFFHKLWKSLIVPMLIICTVNLLFLLILYHTEYFNIQGIIKSLAAIPLGIQSYPDKTAIGIGAMWFVYSLA